MNLLMTLHVEVKQTGRGCYKLMMFGKIEGRSGSAKFSLSQIGIENSPKHGLAVNS